MPRFSIPPKSSTARLSSITQRDEAALLDIAQAARNVGLFLGSIQQRDFFDDTKTQSAVLYQLLVLGEATKRLSLEFRAEHREIPWNLIAGMRDHLIHAYDSVDWLEVWNTATRDVPDLLMKIHALLPQRPAE